MKTVLLSIVAAFVTATLVQPALLGAAPVQSVLRLADLADTDVGNARDGDSLVFDGATQTWRAEKVVGEQGPQGPAGPQGKPGMSAFGFDYLCDNESHSSEGDNFSGMVRFNTANPFAASEVYLGNGTYFGQGDPNLWIKTWNDVKGRVKGYLTLRSATSGLGWVVFRVVGVTDGPDYETIHVEPLDIQENPCTKNFGRVSMNFFLAGDSATR